MRARKFYKIFAYISTLFLFCTFDDVPKEPLTMIRVDESGDTVSIWPSFTFAYSVALQDSIISLKMDPYPGTVFSSYLNSIGDTVNLVVTGSLQGNTTYWISLEDTITAINGSVLYPEEISFEITTFSKEIEPNNNLINVDTLVTVCFGTISPVNDTDYYYVNNLVATTFYQKCHKNKSGFFITEGTGKLIVVDDNFDELKKFTITDTITMPLFIGIFSVYDNDARYEIGLE